MPLLYLPSLHEGVFLVLKVKASLTVVLQSNLAITFQTHCIRPWMLFSTKNISFLAMDGLISSFGKFYRVIFFCCPRFETFRKNIKVKLIKLYFYYVCNTILGCLLFLARIGGVSWLFFIDTHFTK